MTVEPERSATEVNPSSGLPTRFAGVERGAALPISVVAKRLGLSQATLRMWQHRYGLAPTGATAGGHRRYSRDDIDRLTAVQQLTARGVSTGDAARAVLAAARHDIPLPADSDPVAHRVCAAALDLDGPTVRWLLRDHLKTGDPATTWETVVRPVLGPIGDRWDQLPHGIAVEHLLSHIATAVLGEAAPASPPAAGPAPVLLACVPGDAHDLPMIALAAALGRVGVATTVLGAMTPAEALAGAATRAQPSVVVVHAQMVEHADVAVFDLMPPSTALVAAGPGWDPARLPDWIPHVNDLAAATVAVTTSARHAPRATPSESFDPAPDTADPAGRRVESGGNPSAAGPGQQADAHLTRAVRRVVLATERWRLRVARAELNMGATEMIAISSLGAEGPQTPSQIATRLQITTPSVTQLVDRLERAEMVRRGPHPTDGRKTLVALTDLGRRHADAVLHQFSAIVARGSEALAPEVQRQVEAFLHETASAIETAPVVDATTPQPSHVSAP